jgi:hypothetical protein
VTAVAEKLSALGTEELLIADAKSAMKKPIMLRLWKLLIFPPTKEMK